MEEGTDTRSSRGNRCARSRQRDIYSAIRPHAACFPFPRPLPPPWRPRELLVAIRAAADFGRSAGARDGGGCPGAEQPSAVSARARPVKAVAEATHAAATTANRLSIAAWVLGWEAARGIGTIKSTNVYSLNNPGLSQQSKQKTYLRKNRDRTV